MEVCDYQYSEQDPTSFLSQLQSHEEDTMPPMPTSPMPLPANSPTDKCDQIVVLDSSRIAMQIASGQIIWPIIPKPKEAPPKFEPDAYPFIPPSINGPFEGSTDLALGNLEKCKVRKRPRSGSEDGDTVHDGDEPLEKQGIMRWKDVWVAQLIHVRGRMQAAFLGPHKQRVDLWQVVKNELARTCHGFDKDSEACRKKWRRVYKEYRDAKHLHGLGNGLQRCRFYELMEFYMGGRTEDVNGPPAVRVKDEPLCDGGNVTEGIDGQLSSSNVYIPDMSEIHANGEDDSAIKKTIKRIKREASNKVDNQTSSSLQAVLADLAGIGKEMLHVTQQFEQEKMEVLCSLRETLDEMAGKI